MKAKDFTAWNTTKEQLHNGKLNFRFRERDIFFMYVGVNVGFEQDGDKNFLRPVLVYNLIVTPLEEPKGAHKSDFVE